MSWGKKDERLSKTLYENGLFGDERSCIIYDPEMNPHLRLKGIDMMMQRKRLLAKWDGRCGICRMPVYEGFSSPEMDHKQGGLVGRCDCQHNLQLVCPPCHRAKHVQVQLKSVPMEVEP